MRPDHRVLQQRLGADMRNHGFPWSVQVRTAGFRATRDLESIRVRMGAALCGALLSLPSALFAQAQSTDSGAPDATAEGLTIQEVVVTARKRDERLEDVPASIAVFDSQAIEDANIRTIDDLRALAPNVNINSRADQSPDVTLRGVGSFGVVQGVGFYVNDVQQFEGQVVRFEDIERIEVLRGPQGTLYGGSNIGGAIKYITAKPTDEFEGQVSIEAGNRLRHSVTAVASGPLSDNLGARLTLFDDDTDGFVNNTVLGETVGDLRARGGRLTLAYDPGDTSAVLYLYASREDRNDFNPLYHAVDDRTYLKTIDYDNQPPVYMDRNIYSGTLQIMHAFENVQLTSLSSVFRSKRDLRADLDFGPVPINYVDVEQEKNVLSQELRLSSVNAENFSWLVGAFAQYRREPEDTLFHVVPAGLAFPTSNRARYYQYALFANGNYTLGRWTLEAGARVEYDENSLRDVGADVEVTQDGTEVLPRASATYQFHDDLRGYASVTRGFTPGSVVNERRVVAYDAEKTMNYELGLKGSMLDDRVRYDIAAFYIDYTDRLFQINEVVPFVGFVATTTNIGSSINYGFEFSATARLTRDLTLMLGLGVTEAEWEDAVILEPNTGDPNFNLDGMAAPFTPEYQATLSVDWARPVSAGLLLGLRVDSAFIGQQWWDLGNFRQQRAYQLVNVGARLETERWEIRAGLTNALDEEFHTAYYTGPEVGAPFDIASRGQPRAWTVKLTGRF